MTLFTEREKIRNPILYRNGNVHTDSPDYFGDLNNDQIIDKLSRIDRPYSTILNMTGRGVHVIRNGILIAYNNLGLQHSAHLLVSRPKDQPIVVQRLDSEKEGSPISQRYSRSKNIAGGIASRGFFLSSNNPIAYIGDSYCITYLGIKKNSFGNVLGLSVESTEPVGIPQIKFGVLDYNKYLGQIYGK